MKKIENEINNDDQPTKNVLCFDSQIFGIN